MRERDGKRERCIPSLGESLAPLASLRSSPGPGSSLELGSGRLMLGSEPALSRAASSGGVWLEVDEAGLYRLEERAGLLRSASLASRLSVLVRRDSLPTASSKPSK